MDPFQEESGGSGSQVCCWVGCRRVRGQACEPPRCGVDLAGSAAVATADSIPRGLESSHGRIKTDTCELRMALFRNLNK